jgi:glutathione synthase/RimK-type ligase-like ATP-grasp enzyme
MSSTRLGLAVTGPPPRREDPLQVALAARGFDVAHVSWDDPRSDWSDFDVVFVRSPTGYIERHAEFLGWADRAASATDLWNPVELLRWNVHREYLLDLAARGVQVLPTMLVRAEDETTLADVCRGTGWDRAVLKPATAAGGLGVAVAAVDQATGDAALRARQRFGDVVVQPYVPSIHTEGELRLALVRGEAVAAARRAPSEEDFGVQAHKMAAAAEVEPPPEAVDVALAALAALGRRTMHARADLLHVDGAWRLAELELVEPDRMLRDVPSSLDALVDALADACR